jgi:UDP-N-acetyl-D-glucosamine dehydrogenase
MRVSVIGQGYVGLPLALAAASAGHLVTGIDLDIEKVKKLKEGRSHIEDISNDQLQDSLKSKGYTPSSKYSDISSSEVILICVPTPLDKFQKPDISALISATDSVGEHMQENALVILESSVAPGTTRKIINSRLSKFGKKFELAYSPERIDPGNKERNIYNTPKLVAGISQNALNLAKAFYETFVREVIPGSSPEVIETAKLLENSFRLVNISLVNEIAKFCKSLNIDIREVVNAAATKPYGFMPFYPSVGVGGHCIPVDPVYLTSAAIQKGVELTSIENALKINNGLAVHFTEEAKKILGNLEKKRILVIGIAYKPDLSDTRESASIKLIESLRNQGASVYWNDSHVKHWNEELSTDVSSNFDLVIVANKSANVKLDSVKNIPILNCQGY